MNSNHNDPFDQEEQKYVISGWLLADKERTQKDTEGLRSKECENADRTHHEDLVTGKPNICEFISSTDEEAKSNWAEEGPHVNEVKVDIDELPRQES